MFIEANFTKTLSGRIINNVFPEDFLDVQTESELMSLLCDIFKSEGTYELDNVGDEHIDFTASDKLYNFLKEWRNLKNDLSSK